MMQISDQASSRAYASPTPLLACFSDDSREEHGSGAGAPVLEMQESNIQNQAYPLLLSFSDLTYTIKISSKLSWWSVLPCSNMLAKVPETKVVLNGISGDARQGEILAVLGPSGSGKSTLIDALANRISKESLKGLITINGEPLNSNLLRSISAYVMQDDLLFPMLTVEETIMFAAELTLPQSVSKFHKKKRVDDLIDQFDLSNAAKTVVGDEGHRGVSGGERRRVSIAIEIIQDPVILFLDEPTSGLDSTSAFMVVKVLNRIARMGSMVITSIHQPSFRILGLLDQLLILSHGQIVYCGSPSNLPAYMGDLGHPIPSDENPAEAILDLISDLEESADGTKTTMVNSNRTWQNGDTIREAPSLKEAITHCINMGKLVSNKTDNPNPNSTPEVEKFANPCWSETSVLAKRSLLNSFRTAEIFVGRLGAVLITGLILITLYWHLDISPKGSQERLQVLAFIATSIFFFCGDGAQIIFLEKNIMMRETSRNVYRKLSYVLSDGLTWMPSQLLLSITYSAITFCGIGLAGGFTGFCIYFAAVLASFWAGTCYVILLAGLVPNPRIGVTILVATLAYFLIFCGAFVGGDDIPAYWIWFHYSTPIKYVFAAFMRNEFEDPTKCFERAINKFDGTKLGGVSVELKDKLLRGFGEVVGVHVTGSRCILGGRDLIKQVGATELRQWECILIIFAWGFCCRMLFYVTLLLSGNKMKRK